MRKEQIKKLRSETLTPGSLWEAYESTFLVIWKDSEEFDPSIEIKNRKTAAEWVEAQRTRSRPYMIQAWTRLKSCKPDLDLEAAFKSIPTTTMVEKGDVLMLVSAEPSFNRGWDGITRTTKFHMELLHKGERIVVPKIRFNLWSALLRKCETQ